MPMLRLLTSDFVVQCCDLLAALLHFISMLDILIHGFRFNTLNCEPVMYLCFVACDRSHW